MLEPRDIVGNTCIGRQGLGIDHFQQWEKAEGKDRRSDAEKIKEKVKPCNWVNREHGPNGTYRPGKSHGMSFGEWNPPGSHLCCDQSMIPYRHPQTCVDGD